MGRLEVFPVQKFIQLRDRVSEHFELFFECIGITSISLVEAFLSLHESMNQFSKSVHRWHFVRPRRVQ